MLCEYCEIRDTGLVDEDGIPVCPDCRDNAAEAAWERQQEADQEGFRGGEAAAFEAEKQEWIYRNLK